MPSAAATAGIQSNDLKSRAIAADLGESKNPAGRARHQGYVGRRFRPLEIPPEGKLVSTFYALCRDRGYLNANGSIDVYQLSPLLGICQPDLWRLANSHNRLRISERNLTSICRAFNCQPSDVFQFVRPPTPEISDTVKDLKRGYEAVQQYTDLGDD